jgi:hypothetical protein
VSRRALERKQSRGLIGEITLPSGASLVSGQLRCNAGELEGRAYKHSLVSFMSDSTPMADRAKLEWLVRGPAGAQVAIVVRNEKAGTVRATVTLA